MAEGRASRAREETLLSYLQLKGRRVGEGRESIIWGHFPSLSFETCLSSEKRGCTRMKGQLWLPCSQQEGQPAPPIYASTHYAIWVFSFELGSTWKPPNKRSHWRRNHALLFEQHFVEKKKNKKTAFLCIISFDPYNNPLREDRDKYPISQRGKLRFNMVMGLA